MTGGTRPSATRPSPEGRRGTRLRGRLAGFGRDERGSLVIFGLYMFTLMLLICGIAIDVMRYESTRITLQNTVDRAALAAASMNQKLDPKAVVIDYFAKAGLGDHLDPDEDITVQNLGSSRRVTIDSGARLRTHFFKLAEIDNFDVMSSGAAQEAIGNLEISLVLDVSGSMSNYDRIGKLKTAAHDFLDEVFENGDPRGISVSVVPYAEQVNAGETLLGQYAPSDAHGTSHCLNFDANDFSTPALPTYAAVEQTLHFDPWSESKPPNSPVCRTEAEREISLWSNDITSLKTKINALSPGGNTSIDIGLKWGSALLDPSLQGVIEALIEDGEISDDFDGRPYNYDVTNVQKVMVVMTDGENTTQHRMTDPYRSGPSNVFMYVDNDGDKYFSLWRGDGAPVMDQEGGESVCQFWWFGRCWRWEYEEDADWYHPHANRWDDKPVGEHEAVHLDWDELWAEVSVEYHTDRHLAEISGTSSERQAIWAAVDEVHGSTKDGRMDDICTAAKAQGITLFAVGVSIDSDAADLMGDCASSDAHYFDVDDDDIDYAFQAIANEINELRLVQ